MLWLILRICVCAVVIVLCVRYKISYKRKSIAEEQKIRDSKIEQYLPSTITLYNSAGGVILEHPSMVAYDKELALLRYVGGDAKAEQIPADIRERLLIGSPLKKGIVAEFDITAVMFQILLTVAKKRRFLHRPKTAVCAPVDMTDVERMALHKCLVKAKAKQVLILEGSYLSVAREIPPKYEVVIEITPEN